MLTEKEAKISALQREVARLTDNLANMTSSKSKTLKGQQRRHPLTAFSTTISGNGSDGPSAIRSRMGRHASMSSQNALNAVVDEKRDELAEKMVEMFKDPNQHVVYLKSEQVGFGGMKRTPA